MREREILYLLLYGNENILTHMLLYETDSDIIN